MKRPRVAILPILLGLVLGSPLACREGSSRTAGETPPPPASTGATTDPGSESDETASVPVPCGCPSEAPGEAPGVDGCPCADDQACAADHALGDPAPEVFTCRPDCIPTNDARLWCFYVPDAEDPQGGCCSGVCRPDGLCGEPEEPTTGVATDTGSDTDASTGGTSTGGTSTGGTGSSTGGTGTTGAGSSTTAG